MFDRSVRPPVRRSALAILVLVPALLAACASPSVSPSPAATPSPSVTAMPSASAPAASPTDSAAPTASVAATSPSPVPSPTAALGPATAQFALTGTNGLSGAVKITSITCGLPSFDGPEISAGGTFASGPGFVLFVTAKHLEARVGSGAAATLKLRTFSGAGVVSFDSSSGVKLDSDLTETTPAGSAIGTLGALSHISGNLDCGNQQPGTANITISGTASDGTLAGALTTPHVQCTMIGSTRYVTVQALGLAGSTPVLVFVNADPGLLQVVMAAQGATTSGVYSTKTAGAFTATADGVQISAEVVQNLPAGASPAPNPALTLHVEGTATCGTITKQ